MLIRQRQSLYPFHQHIFNILQRNTLHEFNYQNFHHYSILFLQMNYLKEEPHLFMVAVRIQLFKFFSNKRTLFNIKKQQIYRNVPLKISLWEFYLNKESSEGI
ncbi:hypothetical protein pb186bvf_015664 [Paramecium bursaria]